MEHQFVRVTGADGGRVWINLALVLELERLPDDTTTVRYTSGRDRSILEQPGKILRRLAQQQPVSRLRGKAAA